MGKGELRLADCRAPWYQMEAIDWLLDARKLWAVNWKKDSRYWFHWERAYCRETWLQAKERHAWEAEMDARRKESEAAAKLAFEHAVRNVDPPVHIYNLDEICKLMGWSTVPEPPKVFLKWPDGTITKA
jgi:hypothetical protein